MIGIGKAEEFRVLGVMVMDRVSLVVILLLAFSGASSARLLSSNYSDARVVRSSDASDVYERLETYGFPEAYCLTL